MIVFMKCKQILICCIALLVAGNLYAKGYASYPHKDHAAAKTTLADPGEDNYDIKHLTFHLLVTDTSIFIKGNVTTSAVVITPSMSQYIFELDTLMIIDSAKVNG